VKRLVEVATAVVRRRTTRLFSPWRSWLLTATRRPGLAFQTWPRSAASAPTVHFAEYGECSARWGRGLRNAVGRWYLEQESISWLTSGEVPAARQLGSHGDLLRLLTRRHPQASTKPSFRWFFPAQKSGRAHG